MIETLQDGEPESYVWVGPVDSSEMGHLISYNLTSPSTRLNESCDRSRGGDFPFDVGSSTSCGRESYVEQPFETSVSDMCSASSGSQIQAVRPLLLDRSPDIHTNVSFIDCDISVLRGDRRREECITAKPVMKVHPPIDIGPQDCVPYQRMQPLSGVRGVQVKTCDHRVPTGMPPFDESSQERYQYCRGSCYTYVCDKGESLSSRTGSVRDISDCPREAVILTRGDHTLPICHSTKGNSILPSQKYGARVSRQLAQTKCCDRCFMGCTCSCSDTKISVLEDLAIVEEKVDVQRKYTHTDKVVFTEDPVVLQKKAEPMSDVKCLTTNRPVCGRTYVCEMPEAKRVDREESGTIRIPTKPMKTQTIFSDTGTADKAVSAMEDDIVHACTTAESHLKWSTGCTRSLMGKGEGETVVSSEVPKRSVVYSEPMPRIVWPTGCTPVYEEMRTVATETDFPDDDYEEEIEPFWKTFFVALWSLLGLDKATGSRQTLPCPSDWQSVAKVGLCRDLTEQHKIIHRLGPDVHTDIATTSFPYSRPYMPAFNTSPHLFVMDKRAPVNRASRHRERLQPVASEEAVADDKNTVLRVLQDMQRTICVAVAENGVGILRAVQDILGPLSSRMPFTEANGGLHPRNCKHEQCPPMQKQSSQESSSATSKRKGKSRKKGKRFGSNGKTSDMAKQESRNSTYKGKVVNKVDTAGPSRCPDCVSSMLARTASTETSISDLSGSSHRPNDGLSPLSKTAQTAYGQNPQTSVSGLAAPSHHTHKAVSPPSKAATTAHYPDESASSHVKAGSATSSARCEGVHSTIAPPDCNQETDDPHAAPSTKQNVVMDGLQGLRNVVSRASSAVRDVHGLISDRAMFAGESSVLATIKGLRHALKRALSSTRDTQDLSEMKHCDANSKQQGRLQPADLSHVTIASYSKADRELACLCAALSSGRNPFGSALPSTQMDDGHSRAKGDEDSISLSEKRVACTKSDSSACLCLGSNTDLALFEENILVRPGVQATETERREVTNTASVNPTRKSQSMQTDIKQPAETLELTTSTSSKLPSTPAEETSTRSVTSSTISSPSKTGPLGTHAASRIPRRIPSARREAQRDRTGGEIKKWQ